MALLDIPPDFGEPALHWPGDGFYGVDVVGESFHFSTLRAIAKNAPDESAEHYCTALLVPDNYNRHDNKAVAVYIDNQKIAHLSREDARRFRRRLGARKLTDAVTSCDAVITCGHLGRDGQQLNYCVRLDMKEFD